MNKMNGKDFERLMGLTKIYLSENEMHDIASDINAALEYIDGHLPSDTEQYEIRTHGTDLENVFRQDVLEASLSRDELLKNASISDGKCFLVPRNVNGE